MNRDVRTVFRVFIVGLLACSNAAVAEPKPVEAAALEGAALEASLGPDSSWDEILKADGYKAGFPTLFFRYGIGITVDALCVDGDSIRPFDPMRLVCVRWEHNNRDERCLKYETVRLSVPRTFTAERCLKWDARHERCLVSETYTGVHPTSYLVTVYRKTVRGEDREAFKKAFDMPACN